MKLKRRRRKFMDILFRDGQVKTTGTETTTYAQEVTKMKESKQ